MNKGSNDNVLTVTINPNVANSTDGNIPPTSTVIEMLTKT